VTRDYNLGFRLTRILWGPGAPLARPKLSEPSFRTALALLDGPNGYVCKSGA